VIRAARLLLHWSRSTGGGEVVESTIQGELGPLPVTIHLPRGEGRTDAWIVLHGLTVLGREHPSLLRFARALSATGSVVLIPEIDAWTRLRIDSGAVLDAIAAGGTFLQRHDRVDPERIGVVGFSFGATQAMVAAADPRAASIHRVVGFGGYCELGRLATFLMTGEHEWEGRTERLLPDPYARWIVAGNYLGLAESLGDTRRVAEGLLALAAEAGRGGLFKPEGYMKPYMEAGRARLNAAERELWDLFAPPEGELRSDLEAGREIARIVTEAARASDPTLEPGAVFDRMRARPVLAHGRGDRLIPYTETLRLARRLPPRLDPSATVTRLFEHSVGAGGLAPHAYAAEAWRLLRFFDHALGR
jgi:pimeloyl-ACP methyl ester carboxylesterase